MAWWCQFLTARPSQDGRVIAEKRLSAPDALVDFHTAGCARRFFFLLDAAGGGGGARGGGFGDARSGCLGGDARGGSPKASSSSCMRRASAASASSWARFCASDRGGATITFFDLAGGEFC